MDPAGKVTKLALNNKAYKGGAMCSYWFKWPLDARPGDGILVSITDIKNLKIYAAVGSDVFSAEGPLLTYKRNRKQIKTTYPKELFLTLASNDFETTSTFVMSYKALTKENLAKIERSGDGGIF